MEYLDYIPTGEVKQPSKVDFKDFVPEFKPKFVEVTEEKPQAPKPKKKDKQ